MSEWVRERNGPVCVNHINVCVAFINELHSYLKMEWLDTSAHGRRVSSGQQTRQPYR